MAHRSIIAGHRLHNCNGTVFQLVVPCITVVACVFQLAIPCVTVSPHVPSSWVVYCNFKRVRNLWPTLSCHVCEPTCPMERLHSLCTDFRDILQAFIKICWENSGSVKIREIYHALYMMTLSHLWYCVAEFFLDGEKFLIKVVDKFKTHIPFSFSGKQCIYL